MRELYVKGVRFVVSEETAVSIERELRREQNENELYEAMFAARDARDWDLYSDLFKDLHGVRPRGW